ncbi:efflux RND transporter periplasmic adaptor subunit [Piscinibacter sp.]|uniref:efflux RND transporter periplasmic adaptor subunit n=1 Tax=Piscinibacter sp. TaxID=1903157 RepID=UPI0039E5699C
MKLLLAASLLAAGAHAAEPVGVPTIAVAAGGGGATAEFDGVLQPVRQATLTAQTGGNVLALRVRAGERVRRGQPLLRTDDRDSRAGVAQSDAAVTQAEAEARLAEVALTRSRDLNRSGFISQAAVDSAETQAQAARAGLDRARAARAQAALAQGHAEVLAPYDAVVSATHVEVGDLALPGRALLTLYEPGRLRAVVQVPASRAAALAAAGEVRVLLPDGRALEPGARELLPAADPVSQTIEWRLELPAEANGARPGQSLRVRAAGLRAEGAAGRPSLPAGAVLRRGELTAVYVATPQGFALRAVRVAAAAGGRVEVLAGLNPGERVAADPLRAGLHGARAAP